MISPLTRWAPLRLNETLLTSWDPISDYVGPASDHEGPPLTEWDPHLTLQGVLCLGGSLPDQVGPPYEHEELPQTR